MQTAHPFRTALTRGWNWFCGFDDTAEGVLQKKKQEQHLQNITSLKQDKKKMVILNVNLVFLVALCVFLFVFFSTGGSIGIV